MVSVHMAAARFPSRCAQAKAKFFLGIGNGNLESDVHCGALASHIRGGCGFELPRGWGCGFAHLGGRAVASHLQIGGAEASDIRGDGAGDFAPHCRRGALVLELGE